MFQLHAADRVFSRAASSHSTVCIKRSQRDSAKNTFLDAFVSVIEPACVFANLSFFLLANYFCIRAVFFSRLFAVCCCTRCPRIEQEEDDGDT